MVWRARICAASSANTCREWRPSNWPPSDPIADPIDARCLDVTRLISRVGRGAPTGVDRVELAYLKALLAEGRPFFVIARTWLGHLILDRAGAAALLARLMGETRWGPVDTFGHLQRKAHPMKRRAEADLRRLAIARAPKGRLGRALRRVFPDGANYLNVGHSNLAEENLAAWARLPGGRAVVLVHDMIPLDYPQYQRPGTVEAFEEKMRVVARHAGKVICVSAVTEARVGHWFGKWGHKVETQVAPIGVELAASGPATLPDSLLPKGPYFVALGTIEPRKNHALLLDIWAELAAELKEPPTLIVAGSRGWNNADVFARLDAKPSGIIEASGLSDPAVAALVQGADALLFPSHAEGFGLPPAEALGLGTPVICSDLPVLREVLGDSPIYAAVDDMYAWKQSILQTAGQFGAERSGKAEETGKFQRPLWADHFNLVLNEL